MVEAPDKAATCPAPVARSRGNVSSGPGLCLSLDPRAKLLCALAFCLLASGLNSRPVAGVALGLSLVLALVSGLDLLVLCRRTLAVNVFVVLLWVFLPFHLAVDEPLTGLASLHLAPTPGGLGLAWLITLKANAAFFVLIALLGTSEAEEVFHAMAHMYVPAKLVTVFFLFHRYVHVIGQERAALTTAMRIRCFKARTDVHTYRSYAYLVGMLLARSLDRAGRVYQAMRCRGYRNRFWLLDHFHWRLRDTVFCSLFALALAILTALHWSLS